jgi:GNAT superfamily N-acetyltransferase
VGIRAAVGAAFADVDRPVERRIPLQPAEIFRDYKIHHVYMGEWLPLLRDMHEQHWKETEAYRHGLPFNPNYDGAMSYERLGQYLQFIVVHQSGAVVGNGACYLQPCYHTGQLVATEDTFFIVLEHRKGLLAVKLLQHVERVVERLGAKEIRMSVKTVNRVSVLLERTGYGHVANQYSKMLGGK